MEIKQVIEDYGQDKEKKTVMRVELAEDLSKEPQQNLFENVVSATVVVSLLLQKMLSFNIFCLNRASTSNPGEIGRIHSSSYHGEIKIIVILLIP